MERLFEKLNISPKNKNLYVTAFSHSSYANEHKAKNDYKRYSSHLCQSLLQSYHIVPDYAVVV